MRIANCLSLAFVCLLLVSIGCSSANDMIKQPGTPSGTEGPFVDNANGTVTDKQTGLIWLKDGNCLFGNWVDANAVAAQLGEGTPGGIACGLTDGSTAGQWHLPSKDEYQTIVTTACGTNGNPFPGVDQSIHWSSTTYADSPNTAWMMVLDKGENGCGFYWENDSTLAAVWAVRN